jgi:glycosyl transferase family 25
MLIFRKKVSRSAQNLALQFRWMLRSRRRYGAIINSSPFDLCDIYFINLSHRADRREIFERQMQNLNISRFFRFDAHIDADGALGCSLSHLDLLQNAPLAQDRVLMICEDDIQFAVDGDELNRIVLEFLRDNRLDVLCLGHNEKNGIPISKDFMITSKTRTMSCYLVKSCARSSLIDDAKRSVRLLKAGVERKRAAVDVTWRRSQKKHIFAFPRNRMAFQMASYSDIERGLVDYKV